MTDRDDSSVIDDRRIASSAPDSSGARVTIRMAPSAVAKHGLDLTAVRVAQLGRSMRTARRSESHGPSRWMPATVPGIGQARQHLDSGPQLLGIAVTRLASVVVVPGRGGTGRPQ